MSCQILRGVISIGITRILRIASSLCSHAGRLQSAAASQAMRGHEGTSPLRSTPEQCRIVNSLEPLWSQGDYSQSPLKVIERQNVSLLWADQAEPSIPWFTGNQMGKISSSRRSIPQRSQQELNQCECGALS